MEDFLTLAHSQTKTPCTLQLRKCIERLRGCKTLLLQTVFYFSKHQCHLEINVKLTLEKHHNYYRF